MRQQLEADIEAFLDAGGKLERMDMHVTVDLPAKHVSCYGASYLSNLSEVSSLR